MAYEQKPGSGSLFENKEKKSENSPDLTGTFMGDDGVLRRLAAWRQVSKGGVKYWSIKWSEIKQDHQNERPATRKPARDDDMGGDSIPF